MEVTRILIQRYHNSTKWSNRNKKNGYFYLLKKRIKRFLISLSGDDILNMLADVLNKRELDDVYNKYLTALSAISEVVNNKSIVKLTNKHHFIRPLRNAGFSLLEIQEIGFSCSKDLWTSCININDRNLGGKLGLPREIVYEIKDHMDNISNIAANRTVKIRHFAARNPNILFKKRKIGESIETVRYRQTTFNEAFKMFKNPDYNITNEERIRRNTIHFSTFYKYIDNRFKKPFRATDLCHYCEFGKDIKNEINSILQQNGDYNQDFDIENVMIYFNRKLENCIDLTTRQVIISSIDKISDLKSIEYHKSIASRQRLAYNKYRLDPELLEGKLLIDVDYKQKIILGQGPRVLNSEFFEANKKKVVCLGFGIYYVEKRGNYKFVNCLNIDVISNYDGQNASDMIKVFKFVMEMRHFKEIDKPSYIIWTDCGKQFRCAEFIYFIFNDLAEQRKTVSLNFFAEKHGKNMRDQHFSVVSRALQNSTFKNQTRLKSAQDVVNILNSSAIYLNEDKLAQNKSVSISIAAYFDPQNEIIHRNKRIIQDLNIFYNFQNVRNAQNGQFELFSSVFSDCNLLTPIDSVIELINEKFRNIQNADENRIIETSNKDRRQIIENNLTNKRIRIAYISQLSKSNGIDLNLDNSFNTSRSETFQHQSEQQIERHTSPTFCAYNCHNCTSQPNYSIADINKSNFISQIKINDELFLHRHKKSFIMPKTKKYRNVNEAKRELLAHYKYAHNYF